MSLRSLSRKNKRSSLVLKSKVLELYGTVTLLGDGTALPSRTPSNSELSAVNYKHAYGK